MSKHLMKAATMVYPGPAVMVTCGDSPENYNIITIAWTGTINSAPPMTYVSVRKERHSHSLIEKNREFVINLTTEQLAHATDFCGVKSGRDIKKFEHLKLTPMKAEHVKAPLIAECPVNIECRVTQVLELGSHDMFIAEVLAVHVDEKIMDSDGKIHLEWSKPICYSHGEYYGLGNSVGKFGYSVMRPKTAKKYEKEKAIEQRSNEKAEIRERKKAEKEQARIEWEKNQKEWYDAKKAKTSNTFRPKSNSEGEYRPRPKTEGDYKSRTSSEGGYKPRTNSEGGYKPRTNSEGGYKPRTNSEGGYKPRTESDGKKKFDKYADKASQGYKGGSSTHEKGKGHEKRTTGNSNRGPKKVFSKKGV